MVRLSLLIWVALGLAGCASELDRDQDQGGADAAPFPRVDAGGGDGDGDQTAAERCNGVDDDGDGAADEELDCEHDVVCAVFDDGYANMSEPFDAVYSPGADQACVPGGATGECRRWFGRCLALAAGADGHEHPVVFHVFDDGYANLAGPVDAINIAGPNSVCLADGTCRRWFGRAETEVVSGHKHRVDCTVFNDGYAEQTGPSDAIVATAAESMCNPGSECRRWFGRCRTVETIAVP